MSRICSICLRRRWTRARQTLRTLLIAAQRELALLNVDVAGAYGHYFPEAGSNEGWSRSSFGKQFRRELENAPQCYLVVDPRPGLHIVDFNDAYGRATMTDRARIAGLRLFEVFPDNPDDPEAGGISNVYTSLRIAAETRLPHAMAVQRYDIRDPMGRFVERHWRSSHTPILDSKGRLLYLLHHVEDVTRDVPSERTTVTRRTDTAQPD